MYEDQNMYPDAAGFLESLRAIPEKADAERVRLLEEAKKEEERQARIAQTLAMGEALGKRVTDETREKVMEDPNNPELDALRKRIAQGSKLDELMRTLSSKDVENQMREQVWGTPAKSKIGKIGQAILKPIAIAGGAPTNFAGPAMQQYLKMEEQARKGRQTDYAALQAGARVNQQATASQNKTLADLAKTNSLTTLGVVRELNKDFWEGENAEVKQQALTNQKENWDNLSQIQREKLKAQMKHWDDLNRQNPYGFAEAMAKKSPEEAGLIYAALGLTEAVRTMGKNAGAPEKGSGIGYTSTSTRNVLETNSDGTQKYLPKAINTYTRTPTGPTSQGPIDFQSLLNKFRPGAQGAPGAQSAPTAPAAPLPGQQPPRGAQAPLGASAAAPPPQRPEMPSAQIGPKAPKLRRKSNVNPNEDYFLPETPKEREATQAIGGYGALANKVSQGLTEAFNAGGFDDGAVLNAVAKLREEFLGGRAKSASGDNLSFTLDELSNKTAGNSARMKAATAMKDLRELISERTLMVSGKAASDQERAWIKSFMPNPGQANNPEALLHDASRLAAGTLAAQKIKQLGLWNLPVDVLGDVRNAIDNWSMNRVRTLKENRGLRNAGKSVKDPSDADIEQVIIDAITKSKDAKSIKDRFNLDFAEPKKTGLNKMQEMLDGAAAKAAREDVSGILKPFGLGLKK